MSVSLSIIFNGYQSFLGNGLPNSGGFIYTYLAGTTTPVATYTNNGGAIANPNPIPLSASGNPLNAIWLTDGVAYKMVVVDKNLSPVPNATFDNVTGASSGVFSFLATLAASSGSALIGFIQAKVGAITRTVQDKLRDGPVSVKDFGAKGDNTTDDTVAINAAISQAGFAGVIFFPSGTYKISSPLNVSVNSVTIKGAGRQMTAIVTTSPTADIFYVTGSDVIIQDLNMQASVARTAGSFVNFASGAGHTLDNFAMQAPFNGIKMNCTNDEVRNGFIGNTVAASGTSIIVGDTAYGFNQRIDNVIMDAAPASQPAAGVGLYRTYDLRIESCELQHQGNALNCLPPDGAIAYALHAINTYFDSSLVGVRILVAGTGQANNFRFSNCWFGNNSSDGVRLTRTGAGVLSSMHFDNSSVVSNAGNGFTLDTGCEDVNILGGSIQGCNYGVNVSAGVSDWSVVGASIGNYAGGGGMTIAGITISAGASDRYVIAGNRFRGNPTNLIDGGTGTNKQIGRNSGLKTYTTGNDVVADTTTFATVIHNLGFTPPANSIFLNPTNNPGSNPIYLDAATINTTQFIVRCGSARVGNLGFNWAAGTP